MKKSITLFSIVLIILISLPAFAQVSINTDGTDPDASAMLDVQSTEKGMLLPRMTQSEIESIPNPADGLIVYNTTNGKLYIYVFGEIEWKEIAYGTGIITPPIMTVTNPTTGETWMDRNLGAFHVASSSQDIDNYGDLFQWGRLSDGHESRFSGVVYTLSTSDNPWHNYFILSDTEPFDWRSPQNDNLWQGVAIMSNPCPNGFRVPTESEWEAERQTWATNDAAGAFGSILKLTVGGMRFHIDGGIEEYNSHGYYWSNTVSGTDARNLLIENSDAQMYSGSRANGFSVRCIKDASYSSATYSIGTGGSCANTTLNGTYNTGTTLNISNTVNMNVNVATKGNWSITTNAVNGYNFSGNGTFTSIGTVQVTLNGSGTPVTAQTDNFTATASSSGGTCIFDITVTTAPSCGFPFIDTRDDHSYNTVLIGNQCWMAENLNIGMMINSTNGGTNNDGEQTNNGTIEKYCYDNSTSNCDTYGGLYQWDEMMQFVTTEGVQGICPTGWHLPTDAEWKTIEMHLGMSLEQADATEWRGTDEGGKLKEAGTTHWLSPNTGATNSSGFTGLPGGYRHTDGSFSRKGYNGYFWSSSESGSGAWRRYLGGGKAQVYRDDYSQAYGFSVRCVRD